MKKMKKKIGIIDADLIGRKKHRFPNLALMKISAYYGGKLLLSYDNLDDYDEVYISKVFTDTPFPDNLPDNVHIGGTGFYFDKAPNLPDEIEHIMPDYHLYDEWLKDKPNTTAYKEYRDYSIGFTTRGCFRKCGFCVNQKYNRVFKHSPVEEFLDSSRGKICLLDDNILGYRDWQSIWEELQATGKPFKYKQGLDERLLTDQKCKVVFNSRYDGYYTFAFDNLSDYDLIHSKLKLIRKYTDKKNITFYVLCGYESTDLADIEGVFKRISLLQDYYCLPYIMRYQSQNEKPYMRSRYKEVYIALARWCNQPSFFRNMSFKEFAEKNQEYMKTDKLCSTMRAYNLIKNDIDKKYLEKKLTQ